MKFLYESLVLFTAAIFLSSVAISYSTEASLCRTIFFALIQLVFGYLLFRIAFIKEIAKKDVKSHIDSSDSRLDFNPTLFYFFGFVFMYGVLSHEIFLFDNSLYSGVGRSQEFLFLSSWSIYSLDNFIRAVCLDFLETYDFHLSTISSSNVYIQSYLFMFKTVLSILFIKAFYNLFIAYKTVD